MDSPTTGLPITLVTRAGCCLCEQASALLGRLAGEYRLSVVEVDFDTAEGQRLVQQHGILYAPAVMIAGAPSLEGRISEKKLRKEIEVHRDQPHRTVVATGSVAPQTRLTRANRRTWSSSLSRLLRGW